MATFSTEDLMKLDREFATEGIPFHARPLRAAMRILGGNLVLGPFGAGDEADQICAAYRELFPGEDYWPGACRGLAVAVDRVRVITFPVVFGPRRVEVHTGLGFDSPSDWISWCRSDPIIVWKSAFALADVHDVAYGRQFLPQGSQQLKYLINALEHLSDLAASLAHTGSSSSASLQPIGLIAELALKSALLHLQVPVEELKHKFGHSLPKLANELSRLRPHQEDEELLRVCTHFPDLVSSRYGTPNMTRMKVAELAISAQFVAASAVRRCSPCDMAEDMRSDSPRPRFDL